MGRSLTEASLRQYDLDQVQRVYLASRSRLQALEKNAWLEDKTARTPASQLPLLCQILPRNIQPRITSIQAVHQRLE